MADTDLLAPGLDEEYCIATGTVRVMIVGSDYRQQLEEVKEAPWRE